MTYLFVYSRSNIRKLDLHRYDVSNVSGDGIKRSHLCIHLIALNSHRNVNTYYIDRRLKPEILAQGELNVNERHHGYY